MSAQELVELIAGELGGTEDARADAVRVVAVLRGAGYLGMTEPAASNVTPVTRAGAMPFAG